MWTGTPKAPLLASPHDGPKWEGGRLARQLATICHPSSDRHFLRSPALLPEYLSPSHPLILQPQALKPQASSLFSPCSRARRPGSIFPALHLDFWSSRARPRTLAFIGCFCQRPQMVAGLSGLVAMRLEPMAPVPQNTSAFCMSPAGRVCAPGEAIVAGRY